MIMACRRGKEGRESVEDVRRVTGNSRVSFMKLDLSSFKSIRSFVEKFYESEFIHISKYTSVNTLFVVVVVEFPQTTEDDLRCARSACGRRTS